MTWSKSDQDDDQRKTRWKEEILKNMASKRQYKYGQIGQYG